MINWFTAEQIAQQRESELQHQLRNRFLLQNRTADAEPAQTPVAAAPRAVCCTTRTACTAC